MEVRFRRPRSLPEESHAEVRCPMCLPCRGTRPWSSIVPSNHARTKSATPYGMGGSLPRRDPAPQRPWRKGGSGATVRGGQCMNPNARVARNQRRRQRRAQRARRGEAFRRNPDRRGRTAPCGRRLPFCPNQYCFVTVTRQICHNISAV